jgi:NADPH-dependent curcumin reductase CurA
MFGWLASLFTSTSSHTRTSWQKQRRLYAPPIEKNQSINSGGIAQVIATKSSKWKEGQKVVGQFGWYEYGVVDEGAISSEAQSVVSLRNDRHTRLESELIYKGPP